MLTFPIRHIDGYVVNRTNIVVDGDVDWQSSLADSMPPLMLNAYFSDKNKAFVGELVYMPLSLSGY